MHMASAHKVANPWDVASQLFQLLAGHVLFNVCSLTLLLIVQVFVPKEELSLDVISQYNVL